MWHNPTCAGVSVSLIGWPSNLNLICLIERPCRNEIREIIMNPCEKDFCYWMAKVRVQLTNKPGWGLKQIHSDYMLWEKKIFKSHHLGSQLTCRSQYAFISLLRGVCLLILNWTTDPSCPATLRLMWSFSVFTPSWRVKKKKSLRVKTCRLT